MDDSGTILLQLVQGRDGTEWSRNRIGWNTSKAEDVCSWEGIQCEGKFIIAIKLDSTDLRATIPDDFGKLSLLQTIDLSNNKIHGEIPQSIYDLPHLEKLDLSNNDVTGSIQCFASSKFNHLKLNSNFFMGTLPDCPHATNMDYFSVVRNKLQGTIPGYFAKIDKLHLLSLSENKLSGTIPSSLGSTKNLDYLYLDNNKLQGTIPPSLGSGSSLLEIWIQRNLLSGTIPEHIAELPELFNFYVDGNKITGTVPLDLCNKKINKDFFWGQEQGEDRDWCQSVACPEGNVAHQGIYPCETCPKSFYNPYLGRVGSCIDLNERDIVWELYDATGGDDWITTNMDFPWQKNDDYYCGFSGITCDGMHNIIRIDLSSKGLTGTIPESIGFLEYLQHLDLSDNYLTGYLPSDLQFAPLETLDISGNQLKGIIPHVLCQRPMNGNSKGGKYDCDFIGCKQGYYSEIGRADEKNKCIPCDDKQSGSVLASKTCGIFSFKESFDSNDEMDGTLIFPSLLCFVCGVIIFKYFTQRKTYTREDLIGLTIEADFI